MTSQGSAQPRFQRADQRGHVLAAETAARELGTLSAADDAMTLLKRATSEVLAALAAAVNEGMAGRVQLAGLRLRGLECVRVY